MDNDHALATRDARIALKNKLSQAFRSQSREDITEIMGAFDALLVAERAADRVQWRRELQQQMAHDRAVGRARAAVTVNRREAARIRGDEEPRACTRCLRAEGDLDPEGNPTEFYPDKSRVRPHCKWCEKKAGADYRARKAAEQDAAARAAERPERRLRAV